MSKRSPKYDMSELYEEIKEEARGAFEYARRLNVSFAVVHRETMQQLSPPAFPSAKSVMDAREIWDAIRRHRRKSWLRKPTASKGIEP